MLNLTRILILIFLASVCSVAGAVQLTNLYNASVPVPSQEASDRKQGFQSGLVQVLLRLSGKEDSLDHNMRNQFGNAERYVVSFGYRENPEYTNYLTALNAQQMDVIDQQDLVIEGAGSDDSITDLGEGDALNSNVATDNDLDQSIPDKFVMDVVFAESALKARMQNLGLPIWGRSRPNILVWVVQADENGERTVVGASDIGSVLPDLMKQSDLRGVPLYLPVADLTDLSLLDVTSLWGLFPESHIEASRRYQVDGVAILRLHAPLRLDASLDSQTSLDPQTALDRQTTLDSQKTLDPHAPNHVVNDDNDGEEVAGDQPFQVSADWQLFLGEQTYSGEFQAENLERLSEAFVSHLANEVSTLYSVTGNESSDIFSLEVMGIQSFDDYVQVQNYLQNLAPVALVEMKRAEVENLSFDLVLRDSSDKFFQHLSLGRKLIKLEEPIFDTPRQDILLKPVHKFIWQSDIE